MSKKQEVFSRDVAHKFEPLNRGGLKVLGVQENPGGKGLVSIVKKHQPTNGAKQIRVNHADRHGKVLADGSESKRDLLLNPEWREYHFGSEEQAFHAMIWRDDRYHNNELGQPYAALRCFGIHPFIYRNASSRMVKQWDDECFEYYQWVVNVNDALRTSINDEYAANLSLCLPNDMFGNYGISRKGHDGYAKTMAGAMAFSLKKWNTLIADHCRWVLPSDLETGVAVYAVRHATGITYWHDDVFTVDAKAIDRGVEIYNHTNRSLVGKDHRYKYLVSTILQEEKQ